MNHVWIHEDVIALGQLVIFNDDINIVGIIKRSIEITYSKQTNLKITQSKVTNNCIVFLVCWFNQDLEQCEDKIVFKRYPVMDRADHF